MSYQPKLSGDAAVELVMYQEATDLAEALYWIAKVERIMLAVYTEILDWTTRNPIPMRETDGRALE